MTEAGAHHRSMELASTVGVFSLLTGTAGHLFLQVLGAVMATIASYATHRLISWIAAKMGKSWKV